MIVCFLFVCFLFISGGLVFFLFRNILQPFNLMKHIGSDSDEHAPTTASDKGADQTAWIHRLICVFVVCISHSVSPVDVTQGK